MIAACPPLHGLAGSALRFESTFDCFARQLAAGPYVFAPGGVIGSPAFTVLLAIAIALLGYRIILSGIPSSQDTIGIAARVGIVLALLGSWPLYNQLFVDVTLQGPGDFADVALARIPSESGLERTQAAYDTIRLGTVPTIGQGQNPFAQQFQFQAPAPRTAALFLAATVGAPGMVKLLIGFLLAAGPFVLATLLFGLRTGLFTGWMRSLLGASIGLAGLQVLASLQLQMIESELARLQAFRSSAAVQGDPQALLFVILSFGLGVIMILLASVVAATALKFPAFRQRLERYADTTWEPVRQVPSAHWRAQANHRLDQNFHAHSSQRSIAVVGDGRGAGFSTYQQSRPVSQESLGSRIERAPTTRGDHRRGIGRRTRMHQHRDSQR